MKDNQFLIIRADERAGETVFEIIENPKIVPDYGGGFNWYKTDQTKTTASAVPHQRLETAQRPGEQMAVLIQFLQLRADASGWNDLTPEQKEYLTQSKSEVMTEMANRSNYFPEKIYLTVLPQKGIAVLPVGAPIPTTERMQKAIFQLTKKSDGTMDYIFSEII